MSLYALTAIDKVTGDTFIWWQQFTVVYIYTSILGTWGFKHSIAAGFCGWLCGLHNRKLTKRPMLDAFLYTVLGAVSIVLLSRIFTLVRVVLLMSGLLKRVIVVPSIYNWDTESLTVAARSLIVIYGAITQAREHFMPVDDSVASGILSLMVFAEWFAVPEGQLPDCWLLLQIRMVGAYTYWFNLLVIGNLIFGFFIVPTVFLYLDDSNSLITN